MKRLRARVSHLARRGAGRLAGQDFRLGRLAVLALVLAQCAFPAAREERVAWFRHGIEAALNQARAELARPGATPSSRDLPNAGLAVMLLGGDPREAEKFVLASFAHQDLDAASPAYGTIPWQVGRPEIKDANSIEFNMQPVGPLFAFYSAKLSPAFKERMKPHIQAAFVALRRHKVAVTYTNIYLMKTVNLILCGEAVGDESAARDGYAQLDTWIEHTRQAGIGEFDSPNYYAVNLNSLLMGQRFAARPEAREKFRRLLDLFWSDIAANYFPGRGTLSGPHSRGYEFLRGHESVELFLYTEGLRQTPPPFEPSIGRQFLLLSEIAGGYRPPAGVLSLASLPERIVESRYRAEPHRDRYNYVTPDFAAGSASGHYGTHDKLINIELANQRDLPVIYVAPDIIDHPYGKLKSKDRSGHLKPVHAPLNAASVQHKGALLTLLDLDPSALAETGSFATNVVVPAGADALVLDGKPVKVSKGMALAARPDSVLGVRVGNAGVAIRFFQASGIGRQPAKFVFQADEAGLAEGAARLTAYHYQGARLKLDDSHVFAGLLFLVERCPDQAAFRGLLKRAAAVKIESDVDGLIWSVSARGEGPALEVRRNIQTREVLSRRAGGKEVESRVLTVNGEDMAAALK